MAQLEQELSEALRQIALYAMRDSEKRSLFHQSCDAHIADLANDALNKAGRVTANSLTIPSSVTPGDIIAAGGTTRRF